ncbi:MAG: S1 RNA-binding domain-containing protein [Chloroflexi bacterium]|nr:S1 RNA-binding domain-containing protein [Chloroflexota bacterium]
MATELQEEQKEDVLPPFEIDEGYWSALLEEGEYASNSAPYSRGSNWSDYSSDGSIQDFPNGSSFVNEHDWKTAVDTYDQDKAIDLQITGYNRGGLLVSWNSLRGFVPASQLVDFPTEVNEYTRRDLLARRVGQSISLRIIEIDEDKNRLILSERAAQVQEGQRAQILSNLKKGMIQEGIVTNVCNFGAFVDLGGVEGLIHISELSWGRVGHPRDVLSSNETVKVYVMSVDPGEERVALSLKRLQPDPWETVEQRYEVGQMVEGVITNVVDFGAFACIEEGLEGLVHVSELAEGQFLHPRNVVQEGERVSARILNIDGDARRLGLSLRTLNEDE